MAPNDGETIGSYVFRLTGDVSLRNEVFRVAMERRSTFDPEKGTFLAWISGIAKNVSLCFLKRSRSDRRKADALLVNGDPQGGRADSVEDLLSAGDLNGAVNQALDGMLPKRALAFRLRILVELSAREVAEIMETKETNVHNLVSRARQDLIAKLGLSAAGEE